jgi:hypothetical protein
VTRTPNTVVGLAAAKQRLIDAHRVLGAGPGADLGVLNDVLAVALELDAMLRMLGEELRHAKATAAGLGLKAAQQARDLASAEDELGRLRPENALLRRELRAAENRLAEPCTEEPPGPGVSWLVPLGPCVVTGPHVEHRDASGTRWRALTEAEQMQLGRELEERPAA